MTRIRRAVFLGVGALALLAVSTPALADWALNMDPGVTKTSHEVYGLHMTIFYIVVAIGVVVFGAMFYSILRHRKSRGVTPATFHHNTAVEVVWTVIPLLILVSMAVPASQTLIDMYDTRGAEMSVKVTGYQWQWEYEYVDEGVSFYSKLAEDSNAARRKGSDIDPASVDNYLRDVDNPLVVPTDTRVRFLITSEDVIHSWWVPAIGYKKDAIPGYINKTWTEFQEPGTYRGQCAELCGRGHAFMPIVVVAKEPAAYKAWLAKQKEDGDGAGDEAAAEPTANNAAADSASAEG